jgi:NAD(P)-dependent dehydrogenase (short-subunit alcohol dehydrogenase family)
MREKHDMSETQRVAIVTGAAGGIGKAMTRGLLAAGIRVAGVDRDRDLLVALAVICIHRSSSRRITSWEGLALPTTDTPRERGASVRRIRVLAPH